MLSPTRGLTNPLTSSASRSFELKFWVSGFGFMASRSCVNCAFLGFAASPWAWSWKRCDRMWNVNWDSLVVVVAIDCQISWNLLQTFLPRVVNTNLYSMYPFWMSRLLSRGGWVGTLSCHLWNENWWKIWLVRYLYGYIYNTVDLKSTVLKSGEGRTCDSSKSTFSNPLVRLGKGRWG